MGFCYMHAKCILYQNPHYEDHCKCLLLGFDKKNLLNALNMPFLTPTLKASLKIGFEMGVSQTHLKWGLVQLPENSISSDA